MADLRQRIQVARVRAAEDEAIANIPRGINEWLGAVQRKHKETGGCPGCGSTVFAVHVGDCYRLKDDFY